MPCIRIYCMFSSSDHHWFCFIYNIFHYTIIYIATIAYSIQCFVVAYKTLFAYNETTAIYNLCKTTVHSLLEYRLVQLRNHHHPINQPTSQSTNQPANQPINQPTSQLTNQPANQPTNQPINQPINHHFYRRCRRVCGVA